MTREEAIRRIENHIRIHSRQEQFRAVYITEALEMAVDALKAQEPMEPKKVNRYIDFDGEGHPYTPETYDCGACGKELPWKANYCPDCGRAVKWE